MKRIFALLIGLTLLFSHSVLAQTDQPPLLILKLNESLVFQYQDGNLTPLEFCSPIGERRQSSAIWVSPDGFRYAFVTAITPSTDGPNNIRICDLKNQSLILLTGEPQNRIIHSAPAWSPDGTKIAFARFSPEQRNLEFAIVNLANNRELVIYRAYQKNLEADWASLVPQVVWGPVGVVAFNVDSGDPSLSEVSEYVFYPQEFINQNKEGEAVVQSLDAYYPSIQLIRSGDRTSMTYTYVVVNEEGEGKALDIATNQVIDIPWHEPFKFNSLDDSSTAASRRMDGHWGLVGPGFSISLDTHFATDDSLAISPDGTQFAFITFEDYPYGGKVYIVEDLNKFFSTRETGRALGGVVSPPQLNATFGEPGAIGVYWGPSAIRLATM